MGYFIIFVVLMVASFIIQKTLTSRIEKYSKVQLSSGLSGKQVAEKMLRDNGIYDVQVTCTGGFLTDHYDPTKKTVNLSQGVYEGRNIASAAVAAHECGHAVQHATAYRWLTMRSKLVPATQIGSQLSQWVLLAGILLMSFNMMGVGRWVLLLGIAFFAITTLFSIITLPVEYNASERAVEWLDSNAITTGDETVMAKDALKWAARTYLIAAISSLATLLYYVMIFLGGRRD
ncbi:MAG: zinc metallopeptidase [Bacteroidales bacterium]|nr:zinc metallopeptidase [Bacteroidales bacterium]MCR4872886.1 zinc metallopeptidase [Bacteroidales bacterium]